MTILPAFPFRRLALLVILLTIAVLAGCTRSANNHGVSRLRSPSMADSEGLTSTFAESPGYHWADPP